MTHHRLIPFAAIAALVLVLAACEVTITPDPTPTFPPSLAGTFEAQVYVIPTDDPPPVLRTDTVGAQQTRYYRINVPTAARDLLYAEADGTDLRVTLYTTGGNALAVSESSQSFGPNVASLAATEAVSGAALITNFFCVGPCAAVEPVATAYVVGVRNLANSPREFDLYAYTMNATDLDEPNDTASTAVGFGAAVEVIGAIETLGDEDWYRYTGATERTLRFVVYNLGLDLVLEFQNDGTIVEGSLGSGTTTDLFPNDVFRVYSASGLAGPSAESRYLITNE